MLSNAKLPAALPPALRHAAARRARAICSMPPDKLMEDAVKQQLANPAVQKQMAEMNGFMANPAVQQALLSMKDDPELADFFEAVKVSTRLQLLPLRD